MSQRLLIEFMSEEIPSHIQEPATDMLSKNLIEILRSYKLDFSKNMSCFSTPRRIAVLVRDVAEESLAIDEEIKGPKQSAPKEAIEGFLRKYNLSDASECELREHDNEPTYFYTIRYPSRKTSDLLEQIVQELLQKQKWENSMRFGNQSFKWIRPLRNILVMLGNEKIEGQLDLGNGESLKFSNCTYGHARLHPEAIVLKTVNDYETSLEKAMVIANADKRKVMINKELSKSEFPPYEDPWFLNEVNGLVEYPYVGSGRIHPDFVTLPLIVFASVLRTLQKCFILYKDDSLFPPPQFLFVSNVPINDDIIKSNESVLHSRLQDVELLFNKDKKRPLKSRINDLKTMNYFACLGSMYDKVQRLKALAEYVAKDFNIDKKQAIETAELLKADLTTDIVDEFPELQGHMGGVYVIIENYEIKIEIVNAISDHYDTNQNEDLSKAMALIDRIDHLAGLWLINKKPSGSADIFASRRAANGVVKISSGVPHLDLYKLFDKACLLYNLDYDKEIVESLIQFCHNRDIYKTLNS